MTRTLLASLLSLLLLSVGCDSSDPDTSVETGRSTLSVTGSVTDTFQGSAIFAVGPDGEGGTAFVLMLFNGNLMDENSVTKIATFTRSGARPGVGSLAIDPETLLAFYASELSEEESIIIFGESGQLRITSSTASMVKGEFTFVGIPISEDEGEKHATVSGTFEAPSATFLGMSRATVIATATGAGSVH